LADGPAPAYLPSRCFAGPGRLGDSGLACSRDGFSCLAAPLPAVALAAIGARKSDAERRLRSLSRRPQQRQGYSLTIDLLDRLEEGQRSERLPVSWGRATEVEASAGKRSGKRPRPGGSGNTSAEMTRAGGHGGTLLVNLLPSRGSQAPLSHCAHGGAWGMWAERTMGLLAITCGCINT
jgi:hypothetical protein